MYIKHYCFYYQVSRQSPTPAIDILSTRLVTQPKNLGDKKSNFLRAMRRENNGKGEDDEKVKSSDKSDEVSDCRIACTCYRLDKVFAQSSLVHIDAQWICGI